jgi:hypothetical protein
MAMAFSLVYTGEHYVIDVLVGSAITSYAYFFAGRWLNVTAPFFGGVTQPVPVRAQDTDASQVPPRVMTREPAMRDDRQREEPA